MSEPHKYKNLAELLQDRVTQYPNKVAIEFLSDKKIEHYTFFDLHQKALGIAAEINKQCQKGDRVVLLYPPSLDFISAFWACIYAGVIPVPTPLPLKKSGFSQRLETIIKNCSPTLILTTQAFKNALHINQIAGVIDRIPLVTHLTKNFLEKKIPWDHRIKLSQPILTTDQIKPIEKGAIASSEPNDILLLQYTSGSTDDPRGVMLTHANLLENMSVISHLFKFNAESRLFLWLPPYHDLGLMGCCFHPVYAGYTVRLMSPLQFIKDPLQWIEQISSFKADTSGGPNFAFDLCVRYHDPERLKNIDLSNWTSVFNGAETINYQTLKNFQQTYKQYGLKSNCFVPCYGLAESVVCVTGIKSYDPDSALILDRKALGLGQIVLLETDSVNSVRIISCGENMPRQDLKIVSDKGESLPELTLGNVVVNNRSTGLGYWENESATQDIFRYSLKDQSSYYLKTGDIGFFYHNNLYLTGRKKEMLNIHGESSSPQWIEAAIERDFPLVKKHCSAVMHIPELNNDKIIIALEIMSGQENDAMLKVVGIQIFKLIYEEFGLQTDRIIFLPKGALVKTTSGKIPRNIIARQILQHELKPIYVWHNFAGIQDISSVLFDFGYFDVLAEDEKIVYIQNFIIKLLNNLLHDTKETIKNESSIQDWLTDSLLQLEFFSQLEAALGVPIPPNLIENKNITEFSHGLLKKLNEKIE